MKGLENISVNPSERKAEWVRHYKVCNLKMNALLAVLENDGEKMLSDVLKEVGLASAVDVVKACLWDWKR